MPAEERSHLNHIREEAVLGVCVLILLFLFWITASPERGLRYMQHVCYSHSNIALRRLQASAQTGLHFLFTAAGTWLLRITNHGFEAIHNSTRDPSKIYSRMTTWFKIGLLYYSSMVSNPFARSRCREMKGCVRYATVRLIPPIVRFQGIVWDKLMSYPWARNMVQSFVEPGAPEDGATILLAILLLVCLPMLLLCFPRGFRSCLGTVLCLLLVYAVICPYDS